MERMTMEQAIARYEDKIIVLSNFNNIDKVGNVHCFNPSDDEAIYSFAKGLLNYALDPRFTSRKDFDPWKLKDD